MVSTRQHSIICCKWSQGVHTFQSLISFHSQPHEWATAYLPYLFIFTTGYLCQLSLYWILGTFSTDVKSSARTGGLFRAFETLGQTVSYAINSNSSQDPRIALYVNCAALALTIPCMVALIRMVPREPASNDVDVDVPVIVGVPPTD